MVQQLADIANQLRHFPIWQHQGFYLDCVSWASKNGSAMILYEFMNDVILSINNMDKSSNNNNNNLTNIYVRNAWARHVQ